ncbi:MAG: cupin domain-containing protein [Acidobacteriota bacterium]
MQFDITLHHLKDDGRIPNSRLPLLLYRRALTGTPSQVETWLQSNRWGSTWRNGIFGFHHYHSTAHEVLVVYQGTARVHLGGERGVIETVREADVMVIPAGVGHCKVDSSPDFAVVGAYPAGQTWDLCYGKDGERPQADHNIARVRLPENDPVFGVQGPLLQHWSVAP